MSGMTQRLALHGMQCSSDRAELGVVSGYLLKLIRSAIGCRQTDLAELLSVDVSTIQGWESGRRPLTALRATELVRLRYRLVGLGAPAVATGLLQEAVEADAFLSSAAQAGGTPIPIGEHPLASVVHRRTLVGLITWPFTGIVPRSIRDLPAPSGRGPVSDRPMLDRATQNSFFDQMLVAADSASGSDATLLRRQAIYLAGFDRRTSSVDWLAREQWKLAQRPLNDGDLPSVILARSVALALARQGNPEPVRRFIDEALDNETHSMANLTYWAYWLGEIPETYSDDGEMVQHASRSWFGHRLMEHLVGHLLDPTNVELNVHSLWNLVLARRGLLEADASMRVRAKDSVERVLDNEGLSKRARQELASLQCAIQLAER